MRGAVAIFRFLCDAAARGERTVLVTLTGVVGGASRATGTHMAVSGTGAWAGSLSGGCVEAAIVAEAKEVLARGAAELIRFGAGSPFIDVRLPCGGGIDLLFTPDPPPAVSQAVLDRLAARTPAGLSVGLDGGLALAADRATGWQGSRFGVRHDPDLRILAIGHGAETIAVARMAAAYGAAVEVLSPDRRIVADAREVGAKASLLLTPSSAPALGADPHTAIVFLFHDHDWEPALMAAALRTPAFFIGAMGSRATQVRRRALLAGMGVTSRDVDRIVGPVGLVPAARDPDTLALSILAQLASRSDEAGVPGADAAGRDAVGHDAISAHRSGDMWSEIA